MIYNETQYQLGHHEDMVLQFLNIHAEQTLTEFIIIPDFIFCLKKIYKKKLLNSYYLIVESYVHFYLSEFR